MANPSPNHPDLDESINVPEVHAALRDDSIAAGREKSIRENGMEPVGLIMLIPCALILLLGGSVLGKGGSLFGYNELFKEGYMRTPAPGGEEIVLPPGPALSLFSKEGAKVYGKCIGCHGSDGAGGNGIPPLAGSEWVTGNTDQLSQIIIHGLTGPVSVAGLDYNNNMPAMGEGLGPKELAFIMTYIRNEWGNEASLVTPEMGAAALEIAKLRGSDQADVVELKNNHDKMLPGEPLSPESLVDPETLEPVEQPAAE